MSLKVVSYLSLAALFGALGCSATAATTDESGGEQSPESTSVQPGDPVDLDGDGVSDGVALDTDGDGIVDAYDSDGDMIADGAYAPPTGAESGDGDVAVGPEINGGDGTGGTAPSTGGTTSVVGDGDGDGDGAATGGASAIPPGQCGPNPGGTFVVDEDVVFDERTCLTWMRTNATGHPYADAVPYCESLDLGGYNDWRLPTAGEATTIFKCDGMWPPIDDTIFFVMGDGFWTSTESGTIAGDQPKVCGAGQSSGSFYDFGKVGAQTTRCVRGVSDIPDRTDCKSNSQICQ